MSIRGTLGVLFLLLMVACNNDKSSVISSSSQISSSSSPQVGSALRGIWVNPRYQAEFFYFPSDTTICMSSLHSNCFPMRHAGDSIQLREQRSPQAWRTDYWIQHLDSNLLVMKISPLAPADSFVKMSPADSLIRFPSQGFDTSALLGELNRFKEALQSGNNEALKKFFSFPIRGEQANTLWMIALSGDTSAFARGKMQSESFTSADFDVNADNIFRAGNYPQVISKLKILRWGQVISRSSIQTGHEKRDSASININYDPETQVISVIYGGTEAIDSDIPDDWSETGTWIFQFKILGGNRILFEGVDGAG